MLQYGVCPRCQVEVSKERLSFQPIICNSCGFTSGAKEIKVNDQLESRFIKVAFAFAVILIAGFLQAASWDEFALTIIPLKTKQTLGMANDQDLSEIAKICILRKKHDCVEATYFELAQKGLVEFFGELGKYQVRRGNKSAALMNFQVYLSRGGDDLESIYQYARLLGDKGQVDQSASLFEQILKAKPDTLQISVTQNYVKMLMQNGRRDQALNLIKTVRKSSDTASLFMDQEFKTLQIQGAQASR